MATASDPFTGTGSLSANWTAIDANFRLLSDKAEPNAFGIDGENFWNADTFGADQFSECPLSNVTGGTGSAGIGVILRADAGGTYYRIVVNADGSNNIDISSFVSGVLQPTLGTRTAAFANGDVLRAEVQGTTLRVYKNGVQLGADITDSSIATGQPGIGYSSTLSSGALDSWTGGDLAVPGVTLNWIKG